MSDLTNHARAASGTGQLTLCGHGKRTEEEYPVECATCLEMLDRIQQVGRKRDGADLLRALSKRDPDRFEPFQWHLLFAALECQMQAGQDRPAKEDIDQAIRYLKALSDDLSN